MKLSEVIKELQNLAKEHGPDTLVNAYLYKEWSKVRHIGARVINEGQFDESTEIFIEGDKYQSDGGNLYKRGVEHPG